MPGRSFAAGNTYRYGFNGKEKDLETAETTTYDYGFRIYNPGLGKFLSVDPLSIKFPMLTPYQYASNSPIAMIDIDGLEGGAATVDKEKKTVTIDVKVNYDDDDEKKLASVNMSIEDLSKQFKTFYQTGASGYPEAIESFTNLTGVKPDDIDKAIRGAVPKGSNGTFSVYDDLNGVEYTVKFNIIFKKDFDLKDPTVSTLSFNNGEGSSYQGKNINIDLNIFKGPKGINAFSHEIGHKLGLPELYDASKGGSSGGFDGTKHPLALKPRVFGTKPSPGRTPITIGELMDADGGYYSFLSHASIQFIVVDAIRLANAQKENQVKLMLGQVIPTNYQKQPNGSYQATEQGRAKARLFTKKELKAVNKTKFMYYFILIKFLLFAYFLQAQNLKKGYYILQYNKIVGLDQTSDYHFFASFVQSANKNDSNVYFTSNQTLIDSRIINKKRFSRQKSIIRNTFIENIYIDYAKLSCDSNHLIYKQFCVPYLDTPIVYRNKNDTNDLSVYFIYEIEIKKKKNIKLKFQKYSSIRRILLIKANIYKLSNKLPVGFEKKIIKRIYFLG